MPADRASRSDISLALIHLTGQRNGQQPIDALVSILKERRIRASGNDGFIKGNEKAVCFTEMPLSAVSAHVGKSKSSKHPYDLYGIALHKQSAFKEGARPVIYLPDSEASWIPDDQRWRHVRFEYREVAGYREVDFSHEREWRSRGDFLLSDDISLYVIVGSIHCERKIRDAVPLEALKLVLGFLHMNNLQDFL